jgi:hypothetical protein
MFCECSFRGIAYTSYVLMMKKFSPENIIIFQISLVIILFLLSLIFFQSEEYKYEIEAKKPENNLYILCEKDSPRVYGYHINKVKRTATKYYVYEKNTYVTDIEKRLYFRDFKLRIGNDGPYLDRKSLKLFNDNDLSFQLACEITNQENMMKPLNLIANENKKRYQNELKDVIF